MATKTCSHVLAYLGCIHRVFPEKGNHAGPSTTGVSFGRPFEFPDSLPCMAPIDLHCECKWSSGFTPRKKEGLV